MTTIGQSTWPSPYWTFDPTLTYNQIGSPVTTTVGGTLTVSGNLTNSGTNYVTKLRVGGAAETTDAVAEMHRVTRPRRRMYNGKRIEP